MKIWKTLLQIEKKNTEEAQTYFKLTENLWWTCDVCLIYAIKSPKSAFAKVHTNSFSSAATEVIWSSTFSFVPWTVPLK